MFRLVMLLGMFAAMLVPAMVAAQDATCGDFQTQGEAQAVFDASPIDLDSLDTDGDGVACESLLLAGEEADPGQPQLDSDSDFTGQELDYFAAVEADMEEMGASFTTVGVLFTESSGDPSIIFDESWVVEVVMEPVRWQDIGERAQTLDPSPRQQHIHDLCLEINRLVTLAVDDIIFGMNNVDPDILGSAFE